MIAKNLTIKQRYHLIKKPEPAAFELKGKNDQYPRKLFDKSEMESSPAQIIKYAIKNERAARNMESNNTLTFIVDIKATKPQIKDAVAKLYGAAVEKVNTLITFKHYAKKAFVRFKDEGAAIDVASRAGVL